MSVIHPSQAAQPRSGFAGVARILSGLFMAVVACVMMLTNETLFAGLVVLIALFAAREWHRMVRTSQDEADNGPVHLQTVITAVTVGLAILALLDDLVAASFVVVAVGAVAAFLFASRRGDNPLWHAAGVAYIGLPALALVGLRDIPPQGAMIVMGLFLIVWATDTGALVFGKLIGGRKIAPVLSPGKTWAGTIGGSITAAAVFGLYIAFFGFSAPLAMAFAFLFSFVAHGGDLLESWVKRRFGRKDSGSMIPGHGGVLDRVDSIFAASVALALLVFGAGFNPMFGGHT